MSPRNLVAPYSASFPSYYSAACVSVSTSISTIIISVMHGPLGIHTEDGGASRRSVVEERRRGRHI